MSFPSKSKRSARKPAIILRSGNLSTKTGHFSEIRTLPPFCVHHHRSGLSEQSKLCKVKALLAEGGGGRRRRAAAAGGGGGDDGDGGAIDYSVVRTGALSDILD